jgi:hypothetical protein
MSDERARLRQLYEQLLEITDETAHETVDVEQALDVCRMLSSGRAAIISHLDAQIATLTAQLQFLVNWLDQRGLLEEHTFTFPDGDTWTAGTP